MFTIEQINHAHDRFGDAATLAEYVRELNALGVEIYASYLCDGHSEYFGHDGYTLKAPAVHETLPIADISNLELFLEHLHLHNQQKTTSIEMSKGLAESRIENRHHAPVYALGASRLPPESETRPLLTRCARG
jgi:Protein of unknown function (DUF1398)